ncbi:MAG: hypothetical protein KF847_05815, partial [Pirellulales bacterium]|nr:hypothetical protein [Pirellulales bacterium]
MRSVLRFRRAALPLLLSIVAAQTAVAQDLLNDLIEDSPFRLELRPYVTLPSSRNDIISMTTRPGDARPYVTTQEGYVFVLDDNNDGTATATQFFNFAS